MNNYNQFSNQLKVILVNFSLEFSKSVGKVKIKFNHAIIYSLFFFVNAIMPSIFFVCSFLGSLYVILTIFYDDLIWHYHIMITN